MSELRPDRDMAAALEALEAGDAAPLAGLFLQGQGRRSPVLKAVLPLALDGPVADVFDRIFAEPEREVTPHWRNLLRWYLQTEAMTQLPKRRASHRAVLERVLAGEALFAGEDGRDLGILAARLAVERGGRPGLRAAGIGLLQRLDLRMAPLTPALLRAAIQALDLGLLNDLIARWPEGPVAPELEVALDWGLSTLQDIEGLSPRIEALLERRCDLDPTAPLSAQRRVQIGRYRGAAYPELAHHIAAMRRDPADPNLLKALTFAYWQARLIGHRALTEAHAAEALALKPDWTPAPIPPMGGGEGLVPGASLAEPGADLAALVERGTALAAADFTLAGPWTPENLGTAFDEMAKALAVAPLPRGWGPTDSLAAAHSLLQIDRRDYSWCCHFDQTPHAGGQVQYGLVNLRLLPVFHNGVTVLIAALYKRGLEQFLDSDPPIVLAQVARLLQQYCRAALEIDQAAEAGAVLDRVAAAGILADVVAIERDNLALNRGDLAAVAPESRADSSLHPFAAREGWSRAEGVIWTPLAQDAPVKGRFDVAWFDGRVESFAHATPPGGTYKAALKGLRLVPEDFLIGPASGTVLRPDPYHTSTEYPLPSPWMRASGKRALRLGARGFVRHEDPVLVLEAFEILRWRNYYHWIVPILGRLALALDHGLLDDRRLVVPTGLSSWMEEGLALLGLTGDRVLTVTQGEGQEFADAMVLSSVEHLSQSALLALRRRFLAAAGVEGLATGKGPFLFLSRRGQGLRPLLNEQEVEDLAASLGFEVIAPQDLGVAGQVRAFAQAQGVAGGEGAALTNTIFLPPGLGVLAIVCENDMMPIFNDLSIVLGHHHRKLAGRGRPMPGVGSRLQPPFEVDLGVARQSLEWVLAGGRQ